MLAQLVLGCLLKMTVTNIAGADEAERAMVRKPHVAQEEEEKEKEANEEQAVVQPIAELLVAMEQAAVELEAAATEQPAVEQLEVEQAVAEQLEVEQAVAEQPVPRVRLVMKPREEATTRRIAEEQAAAVPLTSKQALQQAQAEGIRLRVGNNATGYFGVSLEASKLLPFRAQLKWSGRKITLGRFATAEEAALCIARSPEGQAAAAEAEALTEAAAAATPPLKIEEALQVAKAEGLLLLKANNKAGYFGVQVDPRCQSKPFSAHLWRDSKNTCLGYFATAEEAALFVARSPEGRAAAQRVAAHAERVALRVPENRTGCFGACLCPQRELAELRALLAAQEDAAAKHAAETSGAAEASALKAAQERHVALTSENCEP